MIQIIYFQKHIGMQNKWITLIVLSFFQKLSINIVTNINFSLHQKKKRDCQIYSPYQQFIGKGFNFEREVIKSIALVGRLSEDNKNIESFFLHRNPDHPTHYLNFLLGRNFYGDINLYFTYDTKYKQWFTTGSDSFIEQLLK